MIKRLAGKQQIKVQVQTQTENNERSEEKRSGENKCKRSCGIN